MVALLYLINLPSVVVKPNAPVVARLYVVDLDIETPVDKLLVNERVNLTALDNETLATR